MNQSQQRYHFLPIYLSLQSTEQDRFFWVLIDRITRAAEIEREYLLLDKKADKYHSIEAQQDLEEIITYLQTSIVTAELRIVLLLDEMDRFDTYHTDTHEQFRALLQTEPEKLKVVATGVTISRNVRVRTSPWYNVFGPEIELRGLEPDEASSLVTDQVADAYTWEKAATDQVLLLSHCKPHDLQKLCLEAVDMMLDENRRKIIVQDVVRAFERVVRERDEEYSDAWRGFDKRQRKVLRLAITDDGLVPADAYTGNQRCFSRAQLYQFTFVDGANGELLRLTRLFRRWLESHNEP
jgi:hypothetical protein